MTRMDGIFCFFYYKEFAFKVKKENDLQQRFITMDVYFTLPKSLDCSNKAFLQNEGITSKEITN